MPVTILMVCLGNICRSPTAEAALIEAAAEAGLDLHVQSAGTGGWHVGQPPDARMRTAAGNVGLVLEGAAARVDPQMLEDADLVLAMDSGNLRDLQRLAAAGGVNTPVHLFRDFDPEPGDGEVPDPYYGGPDGFAEVVGICRRAARELVRRLSSGELTIGPGGGADVSASGGGADDAGRAS